MLLKNLHINHDSFPVKDFYPFNLKIFNCSDEISFATPVTFFAGENGSGKSTLLAAIARKLNIHIWHEHEFRPLKYNPYADQLHKYIQLEVEEEAPGAFFSAQSFKQYAELVDDWAKADPGVLNYYGGESLALRSHGQTNMQYFRNRFKIKGLYLLDEPEAALSPKSQIELSKILTDVTSTGNVQFVVATHSPLLLGMNGSDIYSFDNEIISPVSFKETEYYKVYKEILLRGNM
jgi:predicted ATPase